MSGAAGIFRPDLLAGKVADFCAGWGYLSAELAQRAPAITGLDLYEADIEALEAARGNLAGRQGTRFFWHDLEAERTRTYRVRLAATGGG